MIDEYVPRLEAARGTAGIKAWSAATKEFIAAVRELNGIEAEIADGLRGLLSGGDGIRVNLWIEAAGAKPSLGLVQPLCALLSVRDRYLQHEWVAEILGDIGSPLAVPALLDTCSFDLDCDVFRSLPKRCLQALAAIGTPEAMAAIESQLSSPWQDVRWEASELLYGEEGGE